MDYELIRSDRKTLSLQIKPDGTLLARAPRRIAKREIDRFILEHRDWIEKRQAAAARRPKIAPMSEEELAALKKQARPVFLARAAYFAPLIGVRYERIAVRAQHSKWGSCSGKGNLNFNCLLLLAPPEVLDYVVVHELCHRLHMDHSSAFWAEVGRILPDYAARRQWLKKNGSALMARLPEG